MAFVVKYVCLGLLIPSFDRGVYYEFKRERSGSTVILVLYEIVVPDCSTGSYSKTSAQFEMSRQASDFNEDW